MKSISFRAPAAAAGRQRKPFALAVALCAVAPHAVAQQQMPTVVVSATVDHTGLDTAAQTGTHLKLSRFQTPASVDVIGRAQLEERGDVNLTQAITRAAGISAMPHPGNGGSSLSARGFTDTVSVMRLYDGMRQYGGAGLTFPFDTWSVERIEVLRGPASVIDGEGAIGGVVNIVPKKPSRGDAHHEAQAAIGTDHTARLAFGSGGSLGPRTGYRVDASAERSNGWVDRGDYRNRTLSGGLDLDLAPDLKISLSAALGRQRPMRYFGVPLRNGRQVNALRHRNYNVADSVIEFDDAWTNLSAAWTPNAHTTVRTRLYRIGTDRHWRNAETYTYNPASGLIDRSGNTEIFHDSKQLGNTTTMTTRGVLFGLPNQLSAGFDASKSTFQHTNNTYVGSSPSVDPFNPEPGLFSSAIPTIPRFRSEAKQHAVFVEDRLELSPRWSAVAGLRWDHGKLERGNLVTGAAEYDKTFTHTGWRLGSVFQLSDRLALYGQYSAAADPISALLFMSAANSRFDAATGRQAEVGLKHKFWDRRGEATLAVYRIEKKNLLTRDAINPARSLQVGQRSSQGIEGTVALNLPSGWQIDANAAVLDARFDDFTESVAGRPIGRNGNRPPDVPERLANLWVSRDLRPGLSAGAGVRYVGERFADNANLLCMPSYTSTDLVLRWDMAASTKLSLRGYNVFDRAYFATAYYTSSQWLYGPGRRVELVLDQTF